MEIQIVRNVLAENENLAAEVRKGLRQRNQTMLNFMSAPGAGKTLLLEKLIPAIQKKGLTVGVIEGDITTLRDAERIQPLGVPVAQINTEFWGGDCHLAANVILGALEILNRQKLDIILIENVGNLVCPAEFDTGADVNVVVSSVTEGEDKPLKYPLMFRKSHVALINKIDLAKAVEADIPLLEKNMKQVNPTLQILKTSGKTGEGIDALAELIGSRRVSPN
ncbi:MAG: hydrogenase nickel incorporation protein HypB [Pseudomonadota bacterium]